MQVVLLERDSQPPAAAAADRLVGGRCREDAGPAGGDLAAACWQACARHAARTAVVAEGHDYGYDWLQRSAWAVRQQLVTACGVRPGTLVALMLENSPEYVAAFFGVLAAGGVVVPLPPGIEGQRWNQICQTSPLAVLISRSADLRAGIRIVDGPPQCLRLPGAEPPPAELAAAGRGSGDALAMILYTSGSTGLPKGVMLSHRNLLANARSILQYLPIDHSERALMVLPFYHAFGNSVLQTHLLSGAALVLGGSLTFPASILQAIEQQGATSFAAVPEVYAMLLRFGGLGGQPLRTLRYMTVAGGGLKPELALQVAERIAPARFYVMYGQSEATARLTFLEPEQISARWGSIGRAIPGVELRVADESGCALAAGQTGHLYARGENVMLGYSGDPAATAAVLKAGWLDTGDLVTSDADGYLYLRGRSNLLVKIQGHRVHPREIEDLLASHFPGSQAVVLPYQQAGETRLAAFLTAADGEPPHEAQVRQACREQLPRYKVPAHVEVLERFPLNAALKVDREALARRLQQPLRRAS